MLDFLYVILLVITIFIKNAYSSLKKTQENVSNVLIKQNQQKEIIEQLVEKNDELETELKKQISTITAVKKQIKKQEDYIATLLKENKELKENLEFYTEIESDSTKLNTDDVLTSDISEKEIDNKKIPPFEEQKLDKEQQYAFDLLTQTDKNLWDLYTTLAGGASSKNT